MLMSKPSFKRLLPAILFSFISLASFSQDIKSKETIGVEWQNLETKEGINFQVRKDEYSVIEGQKPLIYTFLKLTNETTEDKMVHFNFGLQFKEGCSGCENGYEYTVDIVIPAMTQIEGDCDFKNQLLTRLIVNPNLQGGWAFENIILTNLTIE